MAAFREATRAYYTSVTAAMDELQERDSTRISETAVTKYLVALDVALLSGNGDGGSPASLAYVLGLSTSVFGELRTAILAAGPRVRLSNTLGSISSKRRATSAATKLVEAVEKQRAMGLLGNSALRAGEHAPYYDLEPLQHDTYDKDGYDYADPDD